MINFLKGRWTYEDGWLMAHIGGLTIVVGPEECIIDDDSTRLRTDLLGVYRRLYHLVPECPEGGHLIVPAYQETQPKESGLWIDVHTHGICLRCGRPTFTTESKLSKENPKCTATSLSSAP